MITYILVCDSAFGSYYISHGDEEAVNATKETLSKYVTGELRIVQFSGITEELQSLIESASEFDKRYHKDLSLTVKRDIEEELSSEESREIIDDDDEDDLFAEED